jgi:hypothetical protein
MKCGAGKSANFIARLLRRRFVLIIHGAVGESTTPPRPIRLSIALVTYIVREPLKDEDTCVMGVIGPRLLDVIPKVLQLFFRPRITTLIVLDNARELSQVAACEQRALRPRNESKRLWDARINDGFADNPC